MGYKIAIDGPSGTGKGYVAHEISKILDCMYVDTGAMYRAFGLYCKNNNIDLDDEKQIRNALDNAELSFDYEQDTFKTFVNGEDVSSAIRTEQVGKLATIVSALPVVRQRMIERQRNLAGTNNVVMEGRDIGSVVFRDAELKIFLTADLHVRAERRYNDLILSGKNVTFEEVLEDIKRRDEKDMTKAISPLIKTDDMIVLDTTYLDKQQVIEEVLKLVKQKGLV